MGSHFKLSIARERYFKREAALGCPRREAAASRDVGRRSDHTSSPGGADTNCFEASQLPPCGGVAGAPGGPAIAQKEFLRNT